jgi:hypothetical protein
MVHFDSVNIQGLIKNYQNGIPVSDKSHYRPLWSRGRVLATGPKVSGFEPGQERWIFKGDKNL